MRKTFFICLFIVLGFISTSAGYMKYSGKCGPNSVNPRPGMVCGTPSGPPPIIYNGSLTRIGAITLPVGSNFFERGASIDVPNHFLYVAQGNTPNQIFKIDLSSFTYVTALDLAPSLGNSVNMYVNHLTIDSSTGRMYASSVDSTPLDAQIAVVTLSSFTNTNPPLTATGCPYLLDMTIDQTNELLYVSAPNNACTNGVSGFVIYRFNLPSSSATGFLPNSTGVNYDLNGDFLHGFLYSFDTGGVLRKITQGSMTVANTQILGDTSAGCQYYDVTDSLTFFCNGFVNKVTSPGFVDSSYTPLATVGAMAVSPVTGFFYAGLSNNPQRIESVKTSTLIQASVATANAGENGIGGQGILIDDTNHFLYSITLTNPVIVIKWKMN